MISFEKVNGEYHLAIPALKGFRNLYTAYYYDIGSRPSLTEYHEALLVFFNWYIGYANQILKAKEFRNEHIAQLVFKTELGSTQEQKEFFKKHIYIARDFVEYLKQRITPDNIHRYRYTINELSIDLQELIAHYEAVRSNTDMPITLTGWRRKDLSTVDIYKALKDLFFIEEKESVHDLYLRDIKPVVIFQIRQLLEVYGRRIIGYYSINDASGAPVKKFTQIAWDFIKEEARKKKSRIELPFDLQTILEVNTWSHSFVHTTYIYNSYLQFFAIKLIEELFVMPDQAIFIYDGTPRRHSEYTAIKITEYNSLRRDFEEYLNRNRNSKVVVEWMEDYKEVGAYIISL